MDKNNVPKLSQEISTLISGLLPIIQLFFAKLPEGVTQIFLKIDYFTGVSIVTLVISYVFILTYQARPFFFIRLPFQKKQDNKYQAYIRELNELNALRSKLDSFQARRVDLESFVKKLEDSPVKPPKQFTAESLINLSVAMVLVNAMIFIVLGILHNQMIVFAIIQAISYVLLISFTALLLSVYYRTTANNKHFEQDQKERAKKVIDMATFANVFGNIPQVVFLAAFEDNGLPSSLHVIVEFNQDKYELIAEQRGRYLIAAHKLESANETA